MHLKRFILAFTALALTASSCSVNNGFIQKRKYKKGFHISLNSKHGNFNSVKANAEKPKTELIEVQQHFDTIAKHDFIVEQKIVPLDFQEKTVSSLIIESQELAKKNNVRIASPLPIRNIRNKAIGFKTKQTSNIQSTSTFNSDLLTIVVMALLIIGAILAFQLIEGTTGLWIGIALIIGLIVIFAT